MVRNGSSSSLNSYRTTVRTFISSPRSRNIYSLLFQVGDAFESLLSSVLPSGSVAAVWKGCPPYLVPDAGFASFLAATVVAMTFRYNAFALKSYFKKWQKYFRILLGSSPASKQEQFWDPTMPSAFSPFFRWLSLPPCGSGALCDAKWTLVPVCSSFCRIQGTLFSRVYRVFTNENTVEAQLRFMISSRPISSSLEMFFLLSHVFRTKATSKRYEKAACKKCTGGKGEFKKLLFCVCHNNVCSHMCRPI